MVSVARCCCCRPVFNVSEARSACGGLGRSLQRLVLAALSELLANEENSQEAALAAAAEQAEAERKRAAAARPPPTVDAFDAEVPFQFSPLPANHCDHGAPDMQADGDDEDKDDDPDTPSLPTRHHDLPAPSSALLKAAEEAAYAQLAMPLGRSFVLLTCLLFS